MNACIKMKNQNLKAGKFFGKNAGKSFCGTVFIRNVFSVIFSLVFLFSFSVFAKDNSLKKKSSSEKKSAKTVDSEKTVESENFANSENNGNAESKIPESLIQNLIFNPENDSELLEIQAELDSAVEMRSSESVAQILKNSRNQENYPQIENLVLEKVRNLVLAEDFELAKNISLCVIEMNIENFEAIDLYSFIEKTIANERAYKRSQILKRNRELKGAGHEIY